MLLARLKRFAHTYWRSMVFDPNHEPITVWRGRTIGPITIPLQTNLVSCSCGTVFGINRPMSKKAK